MTYEKRKCPPFRLEKKGVKRKIDGSKAYDSLHQTTIIQSTPHYGEREHPLPCLTDVFAEVVVLLLQSNQGCSRLESLYYISYIIPHIVGRLYEINTLCFLVIRRT